MWRPTVERIDAGSLLRGKDRPFLLLAAVPVLAFLAAVSLLLRVELFGGGSGAVEASAFGLHFYVVVALGTLTLATVPLALLGLAVAPWNVVRQRAAILAVAGLAGLVAVLIGDLSSGVNWF